MERCEAGRDAGGETGHRHRPDAAAPAVTRAETQRDTGSGRDAKKSRRGNTNTRNVSATRRETLEAARRKPVRHRRGAQRHAATCRKLRVRNSETEKLPQERLHPDNKRSPALQTLNRRRLGSHSCRSSWSDSIVSATLHPLFIKKNHTKFIMLSS